jgi:hypothetical protein
LSQLPPARQTSVHHSTKPIRFYDLTLPKGGLIIVMLVSLPANSPLRNDPCIAAIIERYKLDG